MDDREFKVAGVVAWTRKGVIGVRFTQISDAVRTELMGMIAKLKP